MITATLQGVQRIGESVNLEVAFSDGSVKNFVFNQPFDKTVMLAEVKAELARLNSVDSFVESLKSLIGKQI